MSSIENESALLLWLEDHLLIIQLLNSIGGYKMNVTTTTVKKERYLYIDYLRLLMIVLVVMIHLAVTYSSIGGWYYYEKKELDEVSLIIFALFQSFTQGYFMGFLFFLAGFFVPGTFDKKGFSKFIKGRLFRLGLPTLIYMLLIHPFIGGIILKDYYGGTNLLKAYIKYITSFEFIGESGPLWFAFALLIFSIIYGLIRQLFPKSIEAKVGKRPSNLAVIGLVVMISIGAFLIRIVQPIGTDVMNMQLGFFAQYIVLFIVGMKAYRNHWLEHINYKWGIKWIKAAVTLGIVAWLAVLILGGALTKGFDPFMGGFTGSSLAYATWESFIAVSMSIGLLALYKEKFNRKMRLAGALSESAFTVYVFHAPIIIAISYWMRDVELLPLFKFLLLCIICLPVCFLLSHFVIRKIPLLRKVL